MALSQLGKVPSGNIALLMNTNGNPRKLHMATSESTFFTAKANEVKRRPNANVTSPKATNA